MTNMYYLYFYVAHVISFVPKYYLINFLLNVLQAEPEGCEQCRSGVKLLWENVRSTENMYWEIYLLDVSVCGDLKDPEACKTWFNTWWERLAQMIYGEETVPYVCKEVSHGQCETPSVFSNRYLN